MLAGPPAAPAVVVGAAARWSAAAAAPPPLNGCVGCSSMPLMRPCSSSAGASSDGSSAAAAATRTGEGAAARPVGAETGAAAAGAASSSSWVLGSSSEPISSPMAASRSTAGSWGQLTAASGGWPAAAAGLVASRAAGIDGWAAGVGSGSWDSLGFLAAGVSASAGCRATLVAGAGVQTVSELPLAPATVSAQSTARRWAASAPAPCAHRCLVPLISRGLSLLLAGALVQGSLGLLALGGGAAHGGQHHLLEHAVHGCLQGGGRAGHGAGGVEKWRLAAAGMLMKLPHAGPCCGLLGCMGVRAPTQALEASILPAQAPTDRASTLLLLAPASAAAGSRAGHVAVQQLEGLCGPGLGGP